MTSELDLTKILDKILAESDFRTLHGTDGVRVSTLRRDLDAAFAKVMAPFQSLVDDAESCRVQLRELGYGCDGAPLSMLLQELLDRFENAIGPSDPGPLPQEELFGDVSRLVVSGPHEFSTVVPYLGVNQEQLTRMGYEPCGEMAELEATVGYKRTSED